MKSLAHTADRDAILARLRRLGPEHPRRWGRMSAPQAVCHLADALRMLTGELPVRPTGGAFERGPLKWVAIYAPLRWPGGMIRTSPELDQERGGTKPSDFAADIARLEALIVTAARPWSFEPRPHPLFGPLSRDAWLRWAWLHLDHHLRQFGA